MRAGLALRSERETTSKPALRPLAPRRTDLSRDWGVAHDRDAPRARTGYPHLLGQPVIIAPHVTPRHTSIATYVSYARVTRVIGTSTALIKPG